MKRAIYGIALRLNQGGVQWELAMYLAKEFMAMTAAKAARQ